MDDYVYDEPREKDWNEIARKDVDKLIKGQAKQQLQDAKKDLMKDVKGILNDSRKDVRATKTDIRVL